MSNSASSKHTNRKSTLVREASRHKRVKDKDKSTSKSESSKVNKKGLSISHYYTTKGLDPLEEVRWESRDCIIRGTTGEIIFEKRGILVPATWSQTATDIAISKYLRKESRNKDGTIIIGEHSIKQLITRVSKTIRKEGDRQGNYFKDKESGDAFESELTYILVNQLGAFNSPVWFNCGLWHEYGLEGNSENWYWDAANDDYFQVKNAYEHPQCSACFIQSIDDDLSSIFNLLKQEAQVFKYGSGTGTNFSKIRGKDERLTSGGTSSGLLSFLEVFDRGAGVIKSGGTTRRAAKMVCLDIDHPEILDFIDWKVREERKVKVLSEAGYGTDFNAESYKTVSGQNSNNSIRVSDDFMRSYERGKGWATTYRTTNEVYEVHQSRDLMHKIASAAWSCADPGIQFDTTINDWHTCPETARIYASNPCSEYMFLDDSACNLASINLAAHLGCSETTIELEDGKVTPNYILGEPTISQLQHTARILFIAQEILVDFSSYPTKEIARNSHDYRPLGLGYANLGSLLMLQGIPYASEEGYALTGLLTSIIGGTAYKTSAELAKAKGAFNGYRKNKESMLRVMRKHRHTLLEELNIQEKASIYGDKFLGEALLIWGRCIEIWDGALELGSIYGFRNAQATVIAPTGTIGLLMDCDTTGIEPEFALIKLKKLAGGGYLKIANQSIAPALYKLGYKESEISEILRYVKGATTLNSKTAINEDSLREKGLSDRTLDLLDQELVGALHLSDIFNSQKVFDSLRDDGVFNRSISTEKLTGYERLELLGYSHDEIEDSSDYICGHMTLEGAPYIKDQDLAIFDCAVLCGKYGTRYISPEAHIKILSAAQPFISGSISKTINLPTEATIEDIEELYVSAWKKGLKSVAIYRDGCKLSQPLNTGAQPLNTGSETSSEGSTETLESELSETITDESEFSAKRKALPVKRKTLPDERSAITHKFSVGGHKGYLTIGLYEDGSPGELFIKMSKEGSVISGLMDTIATITSIALQYGVPLSSLVTKFSHMRFEPEGFTTNKEIPIAKSVIDYIFRYLGLKFIPDYSAEKKYSKLLATSLALTNDDETELFYDSDINPNNDSFISEGINGSKIESENPVCQECGSMMLRSGTCYHCQNCGATSGCG